jgi:hypothetical protein
LSGNNLPANATNLNFSGVILPASGSCYVSFAVRGMAAGVQTNTTSGVTTDQSPLTGAPSNTASLTVVATTIAKTFSPATIPFGSTSTVTLTLTNGNAASVLASFSDTLTNMVAVGGPIGGSCSALAPTSFPANATTLNFSGIVVPGNGSCFVSFVVRGTVAGVQSNTTSGVKMNSFGVAGPPSNTASLTVNAPTATIAKAFSPTSIPLGGTSQVRLTLSNASATSVLAAFSDTLVNMQAVGGTLGSTCAALSTITIPANATNVNVSGIVVPANGSCLLTFDVRGTVAGTQSNTTSGVTTDQSPIAGPVSNTATLNVLATTMAKAFSPATIVSGGTSTVTLTLTNTTAAAVLASFTDTLANMTAVGGAVGGSCSSLSGNTLAANATNLNFTGVVVPGNGSCTVTFPVRSTVVGTHPNTTSGVTMNNSGFAGPASNTANLTVTASLAPTLAKKAVKYDFDGDGKSDLSRWRSELGAWEIIQSSTGATQRLQLVEPNDKATYLPVAADFDGDGKYDGGVYRASDSVWLIRQSSHGELMKAQFGLPGDVPLPADFEGDGQADLAVWRNDDGLHVLRSHDQIEQTFYLGQAADAPVIGDFDGDGLSDLAVFQANAGRWFLRYTATGQISDVLFGQAGDEPLTADYDGDGEDDLLVWRAAEGAAYVLGSHPQSLQRLSWGLLQPGERWVIGDYDGDGRAEAARWRVTQAAWQVFFNQTDR